MIQKINNERKKLIITIILVILLIILFLFGFMMAPKQNNYTNKCEALCKNKNMSYSVKFMSIPPNILNGKCYCKHEEWIE